MEKKALPSLVAIQIFCPILNHPVLIESMDWSHQNNECDLCGSHGYVEVGFKCECGESHEIRLNSW